jgi:hypothetical protein
LGIRTQDVGLGQSADRQRRWIRHAVVGACFGTSLYMQYTSEPAPAKDFRKGVGRVT